MVLTEVPQPTNHIPQFKREHVCLVRLPYWAPPQGAGRVYELNWHVVSQCLTDAAAGGAKIQILQVGFFLEILNDTK